MPKILPYDKESLQKLCCANSFELHYLETIHLEESACSEPSLAMSLKHATGAELYIMACESEESAFSYCFATPPSDDKGLPHIVEHSVFCGSKNYPLKEPFANLQKTSVCSFLNALTYPDQTLYPAASAFTTDFMQLLRVYGDAVFFPLFEDCAIAQEGVRQNVEGQLDGIVFNEMQSYYADFDSYVADQSLRNIFPREQGHPNSFDAGGEPRAMRGMDYSEVRDFHSRYYRPENCRIVMYGSIVKQNLVDILRYLDAELFAEAPKENRGKAENADSCSASLLVQTPQSLPKMQRNTLPRKQNQSQQRSVMFLWLLPPQHNTRITLEYRLLAELLLGHSGSILALPAMASNMGADLCMGSNLELSLQQPILRIGLSAYRPADAEPFRQLLWQALEDFRGALARSDSALEHLWQGALNSLEYEELALGEHGGEEGLSALERCLQMAKASHFYRHVVLESPSTKMKDLAQRVFATTMPILQEIRRAGLAAFAEKIFQYTLDNSNWCLNLFESVSEEEPKEKCKITTQKSIGERFAEYQNRQDPPELTAKIRALKCHELGELKPEPTCSSSRFEHSGCKVEFVCHDVAQQLRSSRLRDAPDKNSQEQHSLVCLDCYWDISDWPELRELLLPTFLDLINEMGLPGQAYHKVSQRLSLHFGAWDSSVIAQKILHSTEALTNPVKKFVCMHLSFLPSEWQDGLELFWELLTSCNWHDEKRLHELLRSRYYEKAQDLCSSPTAYAMRRANLALSKSPHSSYDADSVAEFEENCHGLSQVKVLECISQKDKIAQVIKAFEDLQQYLFSSPLSCAISSTQNRGIQKEFRAKFEAKFQVKTEVLSLRSKLSTTEKLLFKSIELPTKNQATEIWKGHLALENLAIAIPSQEWGDALHPAFCVLAKLMRNGPAWESIRLQQGAYGVQVQQQSPYFVLGTTQDCDARNSIQLFHDALEQLKNQITIMIAAGKDGQAEAKVDAKMNAAFAQEFEAAIVQEMAARLKTPSVSERAAMVLRHKLIGLKRSDLTAWLKRLQELQAEDVLEAIEFLLHHWQHKCVCIFAAIQRIEDTEESFKSKDLPCFTEE